MWKTVLIFAIFGASESLAHVKISVYYETLCPYSVNFLVAQFYPTYQLFGEHMITQLIPYGKANATNESGSWQFECQHGEAECYGNKVHSCALELYPESQSFEFIVCSMNSGNASLDANLEECAVSSNITWTDLQECVSSGKGDEYLAANGRITDELIPNISNSVPTIVYNGKYNQPLHSMSVSQFSNLLVFLDEQIHCNFCQFSSGSNVAMSSEKVVSMVALLMLAIQKIFA